jgi:hypothetical protein
MSNLKGQLDTLQVQLDDLRTHFALEQPTEFEPCCTDECMCEELETEITEDDEPNLDTVIDAPEPEERKFTFTESELIDFTTRLVQNTLASVQETLESTDISNDDHVSLELDWNNTIQIEIDSERIKKDIMDEIEDNVSLETTDVLDEIRDILSDMEAEKTYPEE